MGVVSKRGKQYLLTPFENHLIWMSLRAATAAVFNHEVAPFIQGIEDTKSGTTLSETWNTNSETKKASSEGRF
jgi:hypothetical protein